MSREPESTTRMLVVGALLLALLVLSWALAQVHLGAWGTPVSLGIAAIKAGLVVHFFMELSHASASIRIAAAVAAFFFLVLLAFTAADPATREEPPAIPPGFEESFRTR